MCVGFKARYINRDVTKVTEWYCNLLTNQDVENGNLEIRFAGLLLRAWYWHNSQTLSVPLLSARVTLGGSPSSIAVDVVMNNSMILAAGMKLHKVVQRVG